jgi:acyl-CoA dehydrogenase
MRTTAVRDGDDYVINGVKRYISHADKADFAQVMAATDRSKGSRGGISAFIVDMKAPGVKLLRAQELVIDDRPWEIAFEDVKIPVEDRIGEEGDGFGHAQHWLNVGRIRHGARSMGVIERCLELGTQYAKQRVTFGKPIAERQAIQWKLVDMYIDIQALRALVYENAARADKGQDVRSEAAMVKLCASDWGTRTLDNAIQIHGAMGESLELPLTLFYRYVRHTQIGGGTSEIQRHLIARKLLS